MLVDDPALANGLTEEVFPNPPESGVGLVSKMLVFSTAAKGLTVEAALNPCRVVLELPNTFPPCLTLANGLTVDVLLNPPNDDLGGASVVSLEDDFASVPFLSLAVVVLADSAS